MKKLKDRLVDEVIHYDKKHEFLKNHEKIFKLVGKSDNPFDLTTLLSLALQMEIYPKTNEEFAEFIKNHEFHTPGEWAELKRKVSVPKNKAFKAFDLRDKSQKNMELVLIYEKSQTQVLTPFEEKELEMYNKLFNDVAREVKNLSLMKRDEGLKIGENKLKFLKDEISKTFSYLGFIKQDNLVFQSIEEINQYIKDNDFFEIKEIKEKGYKYFKNYYLAIEIDSTNKTTKTGVTMHKIFKKINPNLLGENTKGIIMDKKNCNGLIIRSNKLSKRYHYIVESGPLILKKAGKVLKEDVNFPGVYTIKNWLLIMDQEGVLHGNVTVDKVIDFIKNNSYRGKLQWVDEGRIINSEKKGVKILIPIESDDVLEKRQFTRGYVYNKKYTHPNMYQASEPVIIKNIPQEAPSEIKNIPQEAPSEIKNIPSEIPSEIKKERIKRKSRLTDDSKLEMWAELEVIKKSKEDKIFPEKYKDKISEEKYWYYAKLSQYPFLISLITNYKVKSVIRALKELNPKKERRSRIKEVKPKTTIEEVKQESIVEEVKPKTTIEEKKNNLYVKDVKFIEKGKYHSVLEILTECGKNTFTFTNQMLKDLSI